LFSLGFGSHGQRFLLAVGFSLPTTHDHRKLRGDRGYKYWDIKTQSLPGWLARISANSILNRLG
jgi:hypothetical protein